MFTPQQLDKLALRDYNRALLKSGLRRVIAWILRKRNDLLPLEKIMARLPLKGQVYVGLRAVPIQRIIGTAGRTQDFDRAFLPRQVTTQHRWMNIDKASYSGEPLPPVELVKLGDAYFVIDGHHRISVAHSQGQTFVDARVTEISSAGSPLTESGLYRLIR